MKKALFKCIKKIINISFLFKLCINIFFNKTDKIIFVDIDNTLSDTWPTFKQNIYISEHQRLKSLPIFIGMKRYLEKLIITDKCLLVFLSARSYKFYSITADWLSSNGFNKFCLILVNNPYEKPFFITSYLIKSINKVIIDDLSYNHENHNILFYTDVISIYRNYNYIDIKEINKINNNVTCKKAD